MKLTSCLVGLYLAFKEIALCFLFLKDLIGSLVEIFKWGIRKINIMIAFESYRRNIGISFLLINQFYYNLILLLLIRKYWNIISFGSYLMIYFLITSSCLINWLGCIQI